MKWNTVTPLLKQVLPDTMKEEIFFPIRLVGGTSLSLQLGHRKSVDIDLFTDAAYGSIDFEAIHHFFIDKYPYVSTNEGILVALGSSWFVGETENNAIKVDVYYTDNFIRPFKQVDGVRIASVEDVIAMKLHCCPGENAEGAIGQCANEPICQ